ncbi:diguanylate cyclase [bacterium]|nr:diguanylate cyclase [bacterium]
MKIKVLYIEDNYADFLMLKRILEVKGRYFTLENVGSSEEALTFLKRKSLDCILIDRDLQDGGSLELLKKIKCDYQEIPVIILSNYEEEKVAFSYLQNGAVGFISKDEILNGQILNKVVDCIFIKEKPQEVLLKEREDLDRVLFERGTARIYQALLKNMNEGLIVLDNKGRIIFVNKEIEKLLGCSKNEIIDKEIFGMIDKKDLDLLKKKLNKIQKGEKCFYEINLSYQKKKIPVSINHAPFQEGEVIKGSLCLINDLFKIRKYAQKSKKKEEELIKKSITDSLTGVLSYTQFLYLLKIEFEKTKRYFTDLSCLIIDIDNFKRINEEYGFKFGDKALREIAEMITRNCRKSDVIARFGGEKFIALLSNTNYQNSLIVAEKLRKIIDNHHFTDKDYLIKITFTIGVSSVIEDGVKTADALIENAQKAVTVAKKEEKGKILSFKDIIVTHSELDLKESKVTNLQEKILDITQTTKESYVESLRSLIMALEARDLYTKEHSVNVSKYSYLVAKEMELSEDQARLIKTAGLVHDLGKIGISDAILLKKGPLSDEERKAIQMHPIYGVNIIHPIHFLAEERPIVLYHHERIDGKGYPEGLRGKRIPIGARIMNVVDSFDAMSSPRPYRDPLKVNEAIKELINCAGSQFDPEVVYNLLKVLINERLIPDILKEDRRLYEDIMLKCHEYHLKY